MCVNGQLSSPIDVTSGIPQGSVSGPILFVIYINDIPSLISTNTYLFADDTKLFNSIVCKEDQIQRQEDLFTKQWSGLRNGFLVLI